MLHPHHMTSRAVLTCSDVVGGGVAGGMGAGRVAAGLGGMVLQMDTTTLAFLACLQQSCSESQSSAFLVRS